MSYIGQGLPDNQFIGYDTETFTGDGTANKAFTLSKKPFSENSLLVTIDGVVQEATEDFTVSGTTLTLVGTAPNNSEVNVVHLGAAAAIGEASKLDLNGASDQLILDADADTTISADTDDQIDFKAGGTDILSLTATTATFNDGVTVTTADNTDTLTLKSTDADASVGPVLTLHRESSSPADDDIIGRINFIGEDSGGTDTTYGRIETVIMQESNGSEDATMEFRIMKGGTERNVLELDRTAVIINEDSQDIDFRVESNNESSMLHVNGGTDTVLIGTDTTDDGWFDADGTFVPGFMTFGNGNTDGRLSAFVNNQADAGGPIVCFGKTRATAPETYTIVQDDDQLGIISFQGGDGTTFVEGASIRADVDGTPGGNDMPGRLEFFTTADGSNSGTERMRIASTGNVAIGNTDTTPAFGVTVADTRVTSGVCLDVHHTKSDTTFSGMVARFQSARNTTNETYEFIRAGISGIANKFVVHDSGDVDNTNNSYGGISDERVKQDITDANSQWNDIKALKIKNFKKKANVRDFGDDALKELGVIAQDLEAAGMNGLVKESKPDPSHIDSDSSFGTLWTANDPETQDFVLFTADDEEVKEGNAQIGDIKKQSSETIGEVKEVKAKVKTVKYSILYMKAVKALQEAMARIETLETKVKALEDA
jgi:hypothetical protein